MYIANLPSGFKECDLDNLLNKHGQVISTRILRDNISGESKGVGFARMDSKEKCEQIIQIFNGTVMHGCKEPLLVKFADGGNKKKNIYKNNDNKVWRDSSEAIAAVSFDPSMAQNGVATQHMMPAAISNYSRHYPQVNQSFLIHILIKVLAYRLSNLTLTI